MYRVPCSIGGKNIVLELDVVDCNIPCLISKEAMKRGKVNINVERDEITIFGQKIKLKTTNSGHYILPIGDIEIDSEMKELQVFMSEELGKDKDFTEKEIFRIHKSLGHPSMKVMETMMKHANVYDDDVKCILNKLYDSCMTCFKFKRSVPKPKISPPMANDFNETLCMDLKIFKKRNLIILYIIDMFTRFTVAKIIPDKRPESVIKVLLDCWILNLFGAPRRILFDNGGEFYNAKMKDLCHNFNIKFISTGAESPWQNGM